MSSSTDVVSALDVALRVAAALESLGCEYFIGGSLASSLQGEPRATNDIDLVVAMMPRHVRASRSCSARTSRWIKTCFATP
ncbi:hypothetical protein WMF38_26855 [Sorangium sp. So ce118]